jgi:toxin ParE1/3/4
MQLELSRRARADLDDIRDYSIQTFGIARTIAYLDTLDQAFRRLLSFPEIGAVHSTVQPPVRTLACGQHRIFYDVMAERIVVQRVLHKAMDVEQHIQGI